MHVSILKTLALGLSSAGFVQLAAAETFAASDRLPLPAASTPFPSLYNVVWETPGLLASGSMPTGNGDLSVNVWVEEGGDLLFYVGKTDSWSELERLLKVGRVRVKLSPNPFLAGLPFRQELKLEDGTIAIRAGAPGSEVSIRLYADAHHPVIRFECTSEKLVEVTASTEIWRSEERDLPLGERHSAWGDRDNLEPLIESADVLVPDRRDDVMWYHRNASSIWEGTFRLQGLESLIETRRDPLLNRTFGVLMRGPGFHLGENGTLRAAPALDHELSLHVLTSQTDTPEIWEREIEKLATESDSTPRAAAWLAHQKWWSDFWDRSHVIMSGPLVEAPVITSVPVPLRIGGGDGGSPFHGKIARARLHRDSLSAQEIELLAVGQDAPSPRSAALVGDWDLAQPDAAGDFPNLQGDPLTAKPSGELLVDAADNLPIFSGPAHLLVADDPRLDPSGSMTLDAWVYAEAQPASGGRIFDKGQGGTQDGYVLDTYPGNSLRLISSTGSTGSPGSTGRGNLTAENVLPLDQWTHVAATLDGKDGSRRLYVNGKVVAGSESPIRNAADIAQVYTLQRFLMAASSRGAFPPKFNGAIFNVDYGAPTGPNADFRFWGGTYWFQNTRHLHYPNLADGDFDLMKPFFDLYLNTMELGRARTELWFGHEGTFFPETMSFWGNYANSDYGRNRNGVEAGEIANPEIRASLGNYAAETTVLQPGEVANAAIRYHLTCNIEFVAFLLRYYQYTGDITFARTTLIPAAREFLLWWDQRYSRNDAGEMVLEPAQALEAYSDVVNPASDVAGLTWVLDGLLALPSAVLDAGQRDAWTALRSAVPPLPTRMSNGQEYLAVADNETPSHGMESPELYSIHPFPIFGVGKPGLKRAVRSYWERPNERPNTHGYNTCWSYLSTVSARLGLAEEAARLIASRAALFWGSRFFPDVMTNGDWIPDMDNTGSMAFSVQSMLLQADGEKILIAPAWPKQWNADFKLHAPQNTVVSAIIRDGRLENLKVIPESRRQDVIDCLANPPAVEKP